MLGDTRCHCARGAVAETGSGGGLASACYRARYGMRPAGSIAYRDRLLATPRDQATSLPVGSVSRAMRRAPTLAAMAPKMMSTIARATLLSDSPMPMIQIPCLSGGAVSRAMID